MVPADRSVRAPQILMLSKIEMSPAAPAMLGTEVVSDDAGGDEQQRAWAR
jgi:hypothetical protein